MSEERPMTHLVTVIVRNNHHLETRYHFGFRDRCLALEQASTIAINGLRLRKRTGTTSFYPVHRIWEVKVDSDLTQEDFDRIKQEHHIYEP